MHEKPKVQEVVEAVKAPVVEEKVEEVKQELEEEMMVHTAPVQQDVFNEEIVNLFEEEETTYNLFSFNTETKQLFRFSSKVNHQQRGEVEEKLLEKKRLLPFRKMM